MGKKMRSFKGKMIDIDELKIKNQTAIAIGNNNVNARGDKLDEWGNIIQQRDQVAREKNSTMHRQTTNASIISSFEDDDDYEIIDDPNVVKNNNKSRPTRKNETKQEPKQEPPTSESSDASETDLD